MEKTKKRFSLLGVLAAVAFAVAMAASPAYAAQSSSYVEPYTGDSYACMGDSIAAGFDLADHIDVDGGEIVEGSYAQLVASTLDMEEQPLAWCGFRTNEVLRSLGEDVEDDVYFKDYCTSYWAAINWEAYENEVQEDLQDARVVTLQVGTNDFLTGPAVTAALIVEQEYGLTDEQKAIIESVLDASSSGVDLEALIEAMEKIGYYREFALEFLSALASSAAEFPDNFDTIMQDLDEDCSGNVLVIGIYNPYRNASLGIGELWRVKIGSALNSAIELANEFVQEEAEEHGFTYVDISDATSPASEQTSLIEAFSSDPHPNAQGHQEIADAILCALPHCWGAWTTDDGIVRTRACVCCGEEQCGFCSFPDVTDGSEWYFDWVYQSSDLELFEGYADGNFGPNDPLTRGMVVTLLYRAYTGHSAWDTDNDVETDFPDVASGQWYTAAVKWANEEGIATGYTEGEQAGTFGPNDYVTREQLATFLARYAAYVESDGESTNVASVYELDSENFDAMADAASVSSYAHDGMVWCTQYGIITGIGDTGTIVPQGNADRGQMAKMITIAIHQVLQQR